MPKERCSALSHLALLPVPCRHVADVTGAGSDLEQVCSTLDALYTRSRRCHLLIFNSGAPVKADSSLDGRGGSAVLAELERHFGASVYCRREEFKMFLVRSVVALGWPLHPLPSGALGIGLRPKTARAPAWARPLERTLRALPLPPEVFGRVLAPLLGDAWWGCERRAQLPEPDRTVRAYSLVLSRAHARLCAPIFPFPCTTVRFSGAPSVCGEWAAPHALSLRSADVWTLILLLRLERKRLRRAADVVHVGGLGDVFI